MANTAISRRNLVKGTALAAASMAVANVAVADEAPAANRICEMLGIEKPVVQALMNHLTNPELVAAVSNAGGLGVVGVFTVDDIKAVKALTDKPFAAAPNMNDDETVAMLKEEGINVVLISSVELPKATADGWMMDPSVLTFWKDNGFTVISKALNVTLEGALAIQEAGADIIIPVGYGAGGCGPYNTVAAPALLSEFKDKLDIPMLAAGGIVNSDTAAACMAAGADGIYAGTRFLATDESNCCDAAKQIIVETRPEELIEIPTSYGGNVFGKVPLSPNANSQAWFEMFRSGAEYDEITEASGTGVALWASMANGNIDEYAVGMGRAVNLINEILPAAEVVDMLAAPFMA